jgi:serine/threonine-protein kinase
VREGDAPDAAYILLEGQCELFREVYGIKRFMRVLDAGEVFGETSIFGSSTRTATVAAVTDVTLVRVTRDALQRELERTKWLQAFVQALAERFIELDRKVRELER